MKGIIIGDILGSGYEGACHAGLKPVVYGFNFFETTRGFTDDTILSLANMRTLLENKDRIKAGVLLQPKDFAKNYRILGKKYLETGGWGAMFKTWIQTNTPYYSYGNGSAMRVAPIYPVFKSIETARKAALASCVPTHGHVDGIIGCDMTIIALKLAEIKTPKTQIKNHLNSMPLAGYTLNKSMREMRKQGFDTTAKGSVENAISCFLKSRSFEDGVRKAISLNGDTDTQGAITGALCEAYYGVPDELWQQVSTYLEPWMNKLINRFYKEFII